MGAHPIDDAIWGRTDSSGISINTPNSTKIIAGSHIREGQTFIFCRSDPHELLHVAAHVPRKDDFSWYDRSDFLDNYHDWNKSPNAIDTVNSTVNIAGGHFENQEHQIYYDQPDFLDNYHDWNKSPNAIDIVDSAENIAGAHVTNQEH